MVNDKKRTKFLGLAESRVQNVIRSMEIIMPMGNSGNYDYTEADIELMINAIREKTNDLENALKERFSKAKFVERKIFSFDAEKNEENEDKQVIKQ